MIFPFINGIVSFLRAPVTWILLLMNVSVYMATYKTSEQMQAKMQSLSSNELFGQTQGVIFAQFVEQNVNRYPASIRKLAAQSQTSVNTERRHLLGVLAMRDSLFLSEASTFEAQGDTVAVAWWRKKLSHLQDYREAHPSYNLGVSSGHDNWQNIITYQFTHSGFSHLAGNMFFFLIFASNLELLIGSLGLLLTYLISGAMAALIFSLFSDTSAIPLIGASGAVSGVMALFCVLLWGKSVRYIYFLLIPKPGYMGIVYLPAWITLVLWFVSDLAGHWATPSELGGIAYSAHLGGELSGVLIGLILLATRYIQGNDLLPKENPIVTDGIFKRIN